MPAPGRGWSVGWGLPLGVRVRWLVRGRSRASGGCGWSFVWWSLLVWWSPVWGVSVLCGSVLCGQGGSIACGDLEVAASGMRVCCDAHHPAVAVDDAVVVAAQQDEVVGVGCSTVVVVFHVVGVAPVGWGFTSGEHAPTVSDRKSASLCPVGVTFLGSARNRLTTGSDDHPRNGRITGEQLPLTTRAPQSCTGDIANSM